MHNVYYGEFMGTLVLILLGDGVVADVLLSKSKGFAFSGGPDSQFSSSAWIVITAGWGFAVTMGITTALACGSPFAFINPAVALTVCIVHPADWPIFVPVSLCEIAGGCVGAILVYLVHFRHWEETENQTYKLAIFCTVPQIRDLPWNTITEIIGTATLCVVGLTFANKNVAGAHGLTGGMGPYLWGLLVWAIGVSLGGPTGYAINPARDLGPRIAHQILPIRGGKRDSDWSYAWVPIVGPFIGAAIAAGIVIVSHI